MSNADEVPALVDRAKRGDHSAWEKLHQRYRPQLSMVVHGHIPLTMRGRLDSDDIVQSALLSAFENLSTLDYQSEMQFRMWLRRVVVNKLRTRIRDNERRPDFAEQSHNTDEHAAATSSPSENVIRAERLAAMLEAIGDLEPNDQELVWIRFFEKRAWSDVAAQLGITESSVRYRYNRVIDELTRRLR